MIIISKHTNQLCNRLFTYLPVISYAIEANEPVMFLFQYKGYDGMFPNLACAGYKSKWLDSSIRGSLTSKAFNGVIRMVDHFFHLVLRPGEKIPFKNAFGGTLFNPKWREIRYDHAYIEKHADRLRWLFEPREEVRQKVECMMGDCKNKYVTVGVHMRRGDYKHYKDGRYYYNQQDYRNFMDKMVNMLESTGKCVRFFLASNEKINDSDFDGLNVFSQDGTDALVDLYGLAACDYIIGPPSTFSQWASFYGKKPMLMIYDVNVSLRQEDFKIITTII